MLAGLWGAHNYMNMAMAKKVKLDPRYKPDCNNCKKSLPNYHRSTKIT